MEHLQDLDFSNEPLQLEELKKNYQPYFFNESLEENTKYKIDIYKGAEGERNNHIKLFETACNSTYLEIENRYNKIIDEIDSLAIEESERKKMLADEFLYYKDILTIKAYIEKSKFKRLFDIGILTIYTDNNYKKIKDRICITKNNIPFIFVLNCDFIILIQHYYYDKTQKTLNNETIEDKEYYYKHNIEDHKNFEDKNTLYNKLKDKYKGLFSTDKDDFLVALNCFVEDTEPMLDELLEMAQQEEQPPQQEITEDESQQPISNIYYNFYRDSNQAREERNILQKYNGKDFTQYTEIISEKGKYQTIKIPPLMRNESTKENIKYIGYKDYDFLFCEGIDRLIFNFIVNQKQIKAIWKYKKEKENNKNFTQIKEYEYILKKINNGTITNNEVLKLFDSKSTDIEDYEKEFNCNFDIPINFHNYKGDSNPYRAKYKFDINLSYMRNITTQESKETKIYKIKKDYSKIDKFIYVYMKTTQKNDFIIHISDDYKRVCVIDYLKDNFAKDTNISEIAQDKKGAEKDFTKNAISLFEYLQTIFEAEHKRKIEDRAKAKKTTTHDIIENEYYKDFKYSTFYEACKKSKIITEKEESPIIKYRKIYKTLNLLKQLKKIKCFIWIQKKDEPKHYEKTIEELQEKTLFILKENGKLKPISKKINIEETKFLIQFTAQLDIEKGYKIKDFSDTTKAIESKSEDPS